MRKRGIKRKDNGCCPGHDKYPYESYNNKRSKKQKRRTDLLANKRARLWDKIIVINETKEAANNLALSPQDLEIFIKAIINPPEPNEALKEAYKNYQDAQHGNTIQLFLRKE